MQYIGEISQVQTAVEPAKNCETRVKSSQGNLQATISAMNRVVLSKMNKEN